MEVNKESLKIFSLKEKKAEKKKKKRDKRTDVQLENEQQDGRLKSKCA